MHQLATLQNGTFPRRALLEIDAGSSQQDLKPPVQVLWLQQAPVYSLHRCPCREVTTGHVTLCHVVPLPTGDAPRKMSQLGFDVTPLTAEEKAQEAAKLNDFQR